MGGQQASAPAEHGQISPCISGVDGGPRGAGAGAPSQARQNGSPPPGGMSLAPLGGEGRARGWLAAHRKHAWTPRGRTPAVPSSARQREKLPAQENKCINRVSAPPLVSSSAWCSGVERWGEKGSGVASNESCV